MYVDICMGGQCLVQTFNSTHCEITSHDPVASFPGQTRVYDAHDPVDALNCIVPLCSYLCLQISTIAAVCHSATEGHTVVMMQTNAIHESFCNLFNRRFHCIDTASGPQYYVSIPFGARIKLCRVHPDFECVVIVRESELSDIPPSFLSRFEKYLLSHEQVLEAAFNRLPPCLTLTLRTAVDKVSAPQWLPEIL